jgi:hypothetical protein
MRACASGCAAGRVADGRRKKPTEAGSSTKMWKRKGRWMGAVILVPLVPSRGGNYSTVMER